MDASSPDDVAIPPAPITAGYELGAVAVPTDLVQVVRAAAGRQHNRTEGQAAVFLDEAG